MSDEPVEMPFLSNIGLLMTYKCQVSCPHCIIEAGPHRKEEVIPGEAYNWIEEITKYRHSHIKVLSLTGGEPFYDLDKLRAIASFAEQHGLFVTAVTNAFWASTFERALEILRNIRSIRMLSISTDVYHQQSIPFERVKNAIYAAREFGIPYTIAVCTENEEDKDYKETLRKLEEISETDSILTAITFTAGRARQKINGLNFKLTDEPLQSACNSCSAPILFPDGRVTACIGPIIDLKYPNPLLLGNLRQESLSDILNSAESNAILHAIRIWGPHRLISILKENGMGSYLPDQYVEHSLCNTCYLMMANPNIVDFFKELSQNSEFIRKVAYGRVYYLGEPEMVNLLGFNN